ncbi:saccharopine dehydrogenase family protein [Psychrobacter sp. 2Y5]|uniref:saccharopine dehydrogenase family protein n=1 Tax=unclassified Psychrobacter TaxID=196806 RepID=UPI003F47C2DB
MKVLAIGGSGSMGRACVRAALTFDFVSEIVVAGIDKELAARFVESLNDSRARASYLDVNDTQHLREEIRKVDVVLNTAGPFFRFGVPILSAAIEEAKHYCDICDDWQPTAQMLELSERAKANNVTAIIGLGASPGIANLLCVKAATALDDVETIVSAWKLSGAVNADDGFNDNRSHAHETDKAPVDAAAVHLIYCLAEDIQVLHDGKMVTSRALQHTQLDLASLAKVDVWSLGHPEAITLVRRFPELKNCYNGMLGIGSQVESLRQIADAVAAKQLSIEVAAQLLMTKEDSSGKNNAEGQAKQKQSKDTDIPDMFAYAAGYKEEQFTTSAAFLKRYPSGGMATITGIPLALFLPLLQQGHLTEQGVFAPEEVIDHEVFFELFDAFCGAKGCGLTVLTSDNAC